MKIRFRRKRSLVAGALVSILVAAGFSILGAQNPTDAFPPNEKVIAFLGQTVDWYRNLGIQEQLATGPADLFFLEDSKHLALEIAQLSFDFARTDGQAVSDKAHMTAASSASTQFRSLAQMAASAESDLHDRQTQLEALQEKLRTAPAKSRPQLQSQIEALQSDIELEQTRGEILKNLLQFVGGAGKGSGSLLSQINELQQAIPDLAPVERASGTAATPTPQRPATATTRVQPAVVRPPHREFSH
jgi:HPt (histidine-containing phosphotransfer) domain-containing protein